MSWNNHTVIYSIANCLLKMAFTLVGVIFCLLVSIRFYNILVSLQNVTIFKCIPTYIHETDYYMSKLDQLDKLESCAFGLYKEPLEFRNLKI